MRACWVMYAIALASLLAPAAGAERARSGLLVLYDFGSSTGDLVRDRSGVGEAIDLRITGLDSVRRTRGSLEVHGSTHIQSDEPAAKIINTVRRTGAITIEAWIRPAHRSQAGPARIVTLSRNPNERYFTLGQDGSHFDVRLATTETSINGLPAVSSPDNSLTVELTHIVYTRARTGRSRIYVNGERVADDLVAGATSTWQRPFRLALANELEGDRQWLGTYYLVAVYGRDLLPREIEQNFAAGPDAVAAFDDLADQAAPSSVLFETHVARLIVKHCFECHDATTKEGGLDLSLRATALAGGDSGRSIVAGRAAESLLWQYVETDTMPAERPPLPAAEKQVLKQWIEGGATWSLDAIDPAVYEPRRVASTWLQRLTALEYIETVRSAVGVEVAVEARELLPSDLRADGFNNTAYNLNVDLGHVEAYSQLAEIIVDRMDVRAFARRFSASQKLIDKDNRELIARMGKWLLRGPLTEDEVAVYRGISTTVASAGGDFREATSYVLRAMLQSPRFIYRIENQQGDGTAWPVNNHELACRLSYILWGGPPDEALMRAADEGQLHDPDRMDKEVRRMLEDPRAIRRSLEFVDQWLDLGRLENLQPNGEKFPNWGDQLAAEMRAETLAFFQETVWAQKRPLADLLNAQFTFLTPRLAEHYGEHYVLPLSEGSAEQALSRYDLSTIPSRGGLLTQGSLLTIGGDEASMVTRGLFVLRDFLRGTVKDPPPCVDTTPLPSEAGLTQRGIAEARIADANCGGCHSKFEPLAFGLERFDGLGTYREHDEHGNALRDDGQILVPGQENPLAYESSAALMDLLAASHRVSECITWKLTQFALGRPLVETDVAAVAKIHEKGQQGGGTYASLMTAIVTSGLVQTIQTEAIE